jgi:hypothetical protein
MSQVCPFFPLILNITLGLLVNAIEQETGITTTSIEKEEIKLSLLRSDMIVHIENSKELTKI